MEGSPLSVRVVAGAELLTASPLYRSTGRSLELQPLAVPAGERVKTLALGKLALTLAFDTQQLLGLLALCSSGRWRTRDCQPPPHPDAQGSLIFTVDFREGDFLFFDFLPRYFYHEESGSLRIQLGEGNALTVRAGRRLLAGLSRKGELTDLWLEGLRFRA